MAPLAAIDMVLNNDASRALTAGLRLSVPPGYERLATENVRDQLQKVAVSGHTTVLYTMDGAVYHKRSGPPCLRIASKLCIT